MTMTAQAALPSPPDPVAYHDPHHPRYGFHTEKWFDIHRPSTGPDWFPDEDRYRREANAHAYRQHGTPQNWLRYLTLGFFVYDDCSKFDALWMKYSSDPIICHRMVWYNFMYHIDRKFDIPETLQAWATEVSQPYLHRHAPQYLGINTIEQTWNEYIRGDRDVMDIDLNQWMTVGGSNKKKSRSKSPPTNNQESTTPSTNHHGHMDNQQHQHKQPDSASKSDQQSQRDETSTVGKQSVLQPDLNIPVNDGTYRFTFRWTPKGDFSEYNELSTLWLKEAHAMLRDIFSDDECFLYRWESIDLQTSTTISVVSTGELREFLSPNVAFIPSTSQIIFGARICFAAKFPGQWRNLPTTIEGLGKHKVQISISNSSTTSGKIVTAGYILFKAACTTHRTRFLQSLRQKLPQETPFFDIVLFHRTPTEQKINHLVIQCGENHVSPLSQALSALLTGHNSSLYLSRLALAKLTSAQISAYFEMQDLYAKSLKSFPLFPTLINLDKIRKEIFDDGTIIERSTRDWATTIFSNHDDPTARCEVVNGGIDQKAYLLVPPKYAPVAMESLRQYRLRVNPISRRETRFRDSLPGLPAVIHIDTSTQQNLELLESMSSREVWLRAPASVRGLSSTNSTNEVTSTRTGASKMNKKDNHNQSRGRQGSTRLMDLPRHSPGPASANSPRVDSVNDEQTAFTQSATMSVATTSMLSSATSKRLDELESLFRRQQQENSEGAEITSQNTNRLIHIESKLGRLDDMDNLLTDNREKLAITMERQQDSHVQIVQLNIRVSKLMDVIDRMATRMEVLTNNLVLGSNLHEEHNTGFSGIGQEHNQVTNENTRRRTLDDMKAMATSSLAGTNDFSISMRAARQRASADSRTTTSTHNSPSKKKYRSLQDDMEEMSIGSNDSSSRFSAKETISSPSPSDDMLNTGSSSLNVSDDFSSQMPDPDTQYKNHSDPEGGDCE